MANQTKVTEEKVLAALGGVIDPELNQDLVSLDMIKDLKIDGGKVRFRIQLTTPACPLQDHIEASARSAVEAIPGVSAVEIEFGASVPSDRRIKEKGIQTMRNTIAIKSLDSP